MQHLAEAYFTQLPRLPRRRHPGTSGYPALANLLNAVGDSRKPKISLLSYAVSNGFFRDPAFLIAPPFLIFRLALQ